MKPKLKELTPIAPKGAAVMGAFLFGMTTIGIGAFAMRDQSPAVAEQTPSAPIISAPDATTRIAHGLQTPPAPDAFDISVGSQPSFGHPVTPVETPRLASLTPTNTTLDQGLLSPLSRIFLGTPPLTPPARPGADTQAGTEETPPATPDIPDSTGLAEIADGQAPSGLLASLRPQPRPTTLHITSETSTQEPVRVASRNRAGVSWGTAELKHEPAPVPQTPRIAAPSAQCPKQLARSMPRRANGAPGASTFLASLQAVDGVKRDAQVVSEILKGNMPRFQKNLVPVTLSGETSDGKTAYITLCVTPDYLALGSDSDFVRVPLGLDGASQVARSFNMLLPTPRMVDAIYHQAALRLSPSPMTPGPKMTSTAYFTRHNATVESQRENAGATHGTLISGHKKDVVSTSRLASNRGRVAIYGWHRPNGQPIQPLSTVHGAGYADYSHGIRLVSQTAYLNGREVDLRNLIADPRYAGVISHEGPLGRAALASN